MSSVLLQVVLDSISMEDALHTASIAVNNGADIVEADTLLIKAYGMQVIKGLRQVCLNTPILADMKVLDNAAREVELAVSSGADIVSVSALASDKTILDAVLAADKHGAKIMVDLTHVTNPLDRALTLCERGIDYICIHASDVNNSSISIKVVKGLSSSCRVPIAVEGIEEESCICEFIKAGASIVVIGSIAKADDIASRVRWLKRLLQCT